MLNNDTLTSKLFKMGSMTELFVYVLLILSVEILFEIVIIRVVDLFLMLCDSFKFMFDIIYPPREETFEDMMLHYTDMLTREFTQFVESSEFKQRTGSDRSLEVIFQAVKESGKTRLHKKVYNL